MVFMCFANASRFLDWWHAVQRTVDGCEWALQRRRARPAHWVETRKPILPQPAYVRCWHAIRMLYPSGSPCQTLCFKRLVSLP